MRTQHYAVMYGTLSIVLTLMATASTTASSGPNDLENQNSFIIDDPMTMRVSCSAYRSCLITTEFLKNAPDSDSIKQECRHITKSFHCQRTSTEDCIRKGLVDPVGLRKMRRAYVVTEIYMQEICNPGSLPDRAVSKDSVQCKEFRSCLQDISKVKAAPTALQACRVATRVFQCIKSAAEDCRRRTPKLSPETLVYMDDTALSSWRNMDKHCAYTTPTTTTPPLPNSPMTAVHCFEFATCPRPESDVIRRARRLRKYKDACSQQVPYTNCIKLALSDCILKQLVADVALQTMKESVIEAQRAQDTYCQANDTSLMAQNGFSADSDRGYGKRTSHDPVRCLDIGSCPDPVYGMRWISNKTELESGCRKMRAHARCIKQVTADCKDRRIIQGEALKSMLRGVEESRRIVDTYCSTGGGGGNSGRNTGSGGHGDDNRRGPNGGFSSPRLYPGLASLLLCLPVGIVTTSVWGIVGYPFSSF